MQAGLFALLVPAALLVLRADGSLARELAAEARLYVEVLLAAWVPLVAVGAWAGRREDAMVRERDDLESLAVTDPLTGLKNVRYFRARLAEACARARREGHSVALAVIDLDHFKLINDRHGHAAGDRMLAAAACAVASVCREGETAARIGGEELAVILPGAGSDAALVAGERIRRAIAAQAIREGTAIVRVTASVGVASTQQSSAPTPDALFAAADAALFAAKAAGRDRTSVAPPCRARDKPAGPEPGQWSEPRTARRQQRLPDNYS